MWNEVTGASAGSMTRSVTVRRWCSVVVENTTRSRYSRSSIARAQSVACRPTTKRITATIPCSANTIQTRRIQRR